MQRETGLTVKNSAAIIKQIERVFGDESPPNKVVENLGGGNEPQIVQRLFHKRTWRSITWQELKNEPKMDTAAPFYFLTDEAFVYYLPAFMRICLQHKSSDDLDLFPIKLIWSLNPKAEPRFEKYNSMTLERKQTIALFLNFFADPPISNSDATKSLQEYWYQFSSQE